MAYDDFADPTYQPYQPDPNEPQPLDQMLPQMMAKDAAGSIGGTPYTPESGGMPDPYASTPGPAAPAAPAAPAMPAPAMPGAPAPYSGYVNPFNDAVHSQILDSMSKLSAPPSLTDPTLAPQASAYQGARERSRRQQQEADAERAHARGETTGSLDSSIAGGYDSMGRDIGAYDANLLGADATSKRSALLNAEGLGAGVSAAGGSNQLGQDTLGFNVGTEEAALNAALMRALMGGV